MATPTELTDQQEITDDEQVKSTVLKHYHAIGSTRQEVDWQNFKNEAYYRGKHFVSWSTVDKTLREPPAKQGEVRIPIPLAKDIVQRTLLEVTKDKPTFQVIPESTNPQEIKRARWSNMLLDALYEKHRLGKKIKQMVLSGLKTSVGVMEVFWDKELDDGGDVNFRNIPTEDFYIGINFEEVKDAPVVIKIIRKDLGYLLSSKLYKRLRPKWAATIEPDNKSTDNAWREQVLSAIYGQTGDLTNIPVPQGSVLLAECYLKYYPKGSIKPKYRIATVAIKQELLLRNEETDLEQPPFFVYHTDQNSGEFYGEGWLKHLVPLNKAVDLIENKNLQHHHKFTGGKFVADLGADPNTVTNDAGQIIEVNPGRRFDALNVPPIPPTVRDTIKSFHQYAQDTGGVHEASLGRVPQGVESARGLEALTQADQHQKSDLKSNLEDTLEEIGEYALKLISDNYTTSRLVSLYNEKGDLEQFYAIGEGSPNPDKQGFDVIIKPRNDVKVTVGSKLAYTPEARQQKAIELYQMGLLPKEEVLKEFGYGNIADIVQSATEQAMQMLKAKQEQPERDTRDYVNTKLSDMAPSERSQYLQSIGIEPEQDPTQIPGAVAALGSLTEQKATMELENALVKQGHQVETQTDQQVEQSLNPFLQGGAIDLTQPNQEEYGQTAASL